MGPIALDRRTGTVRSSVRSHEITGSRPGVPRRHHCRPAALFFGEFGALVGQSGRLRSLGVAGQRLWLA
jgi:hypothetical protein